MSDTGDTLGNSATGTGIDLTHELDNQGHNNLTAIAEPKLLLTVEEAAQRLSIGRPKMWQLVMRGEVLSVKIGASRRVPTTALVDYVRRLSGEFVPTVETHDAIGVSGRQHDEHDVTVAGFSYRANGVFGGRGPYGAHARTEQGRAVRDEAERAESTKRKEGAV